MEKFQTDFPQTGKKRKHDLELKFPEVFLNLLALWHIFIELASYVWGSPEKVEGVRWGMGSSQNSRLLGLSGSPKRAAATSVF